MVKLNIVQSIIATNRRICSISMSRSTRTERKLLRNEISLKNGFLQCLAWMHQLIFFEKKLDPILGINKQFRINVRKKIIEQNSKLLFDRKWNQIQNNNKKFCQILVLKKINKIIDYVHFQSIKNNFHSVVWQCVFMEYSVVKYWKNKLRFNLNLNLQKKINEFNEFNENVWFLELSYGFNDWCEM